LSYDLYITGPEPTVGVLVQASALVTGSGSEDRTLMQVLSYTFTIGGILNDTLGISYGYGITDKLAVAGTGHYYVEGSPSDGITGGSIEDSVYTFSTNHLYQIDMNFSLSSHAGTATMGNNDNSSILLGGKIQGSVIIDPSYEIALGTPDADAYTIHLSPGVAVGAPESSTWSMMLLGLGSLGLVGRLSIRKKRAR
jgi:hypothetical protein